MIFNEFIEPCHVNNFILFQASSFNSYTLIVFQDSQASSIGTDIWIRECAKNLFPLLTIETTKMENWLKEVGPFLLFSDHSSWSLSALLSFIYLQICLLQRQGAKWLQTLNRFNGSEGGLENYTYDNP